jgi:hypothetical protein
MSACAITDEIEESKASRCLFKVKFVRLGQQQFSYGQLNLIASPLPE